MFKLLRQQASTYRMIQALTAFMYLSVTFAVPLIHTCGPSETVSSHHFDNPDLCCCVEINTDAQFEISSKKDVPKAKTLSHSDICTACLYSLISKFTQAKTTTSLINITVFNSSRILSIAGVIKQSEWLISVSLRAPPAINS